MKWLIFCAFFAHFAVFIQAASIEQNTAAIAQSKAKSAQLSKKLEDLAADIINGEKSLKELDEQVKSSAARTAELEKLVSSQNSELDVIILQNKDLIADKNTLEKKLSSLIAKEFAYDLVAPKDVIESAASVINSQIISSLSRVLGKEFSRLGKDYERTLSKINAKQQKISEIYANIQEFKKRTNELKALKARQQKLLAEQKSSQNEYKRRLDALAREQSELQATLKKLKIMQEQKIAASKAAAKAAAAKKTAAQMAKNTALKASEVKHSSELGYSGAVEKYTGAKLIAPLEKYSVKQKFGYYTDPIYNLKIFNENVVLKSHTPNANVRVIADGKVVYVGETAVLEKIIIVEHAGGLHSIYAHLDKFSQLAKNGTRLKAGSVIGKINHELTFEITQKSAHVDPLTVIK